MPPALSLSEALYRVFAIQRDPELVSDLDHAIRESLFALFLKARDMVLAFQADPDADWQSAGLPQLNALHEWAVTVFLGTSDVFHPGITPTNFVWQPVRPGT